LIQPGLVALILSRYCLSPHGIHGIAHWARVLENGRRLSADTGARLGVVELFAVFHDSRRRSEGRDPGHGRRGAELARELRATHLDLYDNDFELLVEACARHTEGGTDGDVTVRTCWDADRLDLERVGIRTDPRRLCTTAAREIGLLGWASRRATQRFVPRAVLEEWGIDPSGPQLSGRPLGRCS
jgi:uncharacterized protein